MPLAAWSHLGNNLPANSLTLSFRRRFDRGLGLLLLMILVKGQGREVSAGQLRTVME